MSDDLSDFVAKLLEKEPAKPIGLSVEARTSMPLVNAFDPASALLSPGQTMPLSGGGPTQSVRFAPVQTMFEGKIDYAACWNFYVRRIGSHAYGRLRTDGGNFFENVPPTRTEDMRYLAEIVFGKNNLLLRVNRPPNEEEEYLRLLIVWAWLKQQPLVWDLNKFGAYNARHGKQDEWGGASFYADMHRREGTFLMGACNAVSVLFATLLLAAGMEPWRLGIFSTRYEHPDVDGTPSHIYNGIYLFGRWRYLDVQAVHGPLFPARDEANERQGGRKLNIGIIDTCDYAHPFGGEMPQAEYWAGLPDVKLPAVPMLGAAPYELI